MNDRFHKYAAKIAGAVGSPWAFMGAVTILIAWAVAGPALHYSDQWQLFINTGTTIVTFLIVFLIQNTQNRDAKALHLKLDELLRAVGEARNSLVDLENLPEEELNRLETEFRRLREAQNTEESLVNELDEKISDVQEETKAKK